MDILYPIEWAVAWIMVQFHSLFTLIGLDKDSGWAWALSIVGLTVVVRILIFPLFVKQIKSSRAMQMVAPRIKEIQKKYKGKTDPASKQAMTEETMAAYKEAKANPFASCLPILLQMPIFFALFRMLFYKLPEAAQKSQDFGPLTAELAKSAEHSVWILGVGISQSFMSSGWEPKLVAGIIIALMSLVTFITQKELTMRNMPKEALEGPMASTQKAMLYMLPFIYVITGPSMPIGILIYWLTTNLWTFGQQWWVISATPTPGSEAEKKREARINARRAKKGLEPIDFAAKRRAEELKNKPETIRVQPVGKKRGGKKLSDEEKLRRARETRERLKAQRNNGKGKGKKEKR
ncbi:membrane protein insertase YidC [Dermabacteraceae bacterium P13115]|nr:membrane protein insertase YidC [Dermabacteraceae bacterium TAE3-ERU5]